MDEVFGMLMGREASADSLFAVVDSSYGALKALAASAQTHPTVLMDKKTGSVWYVPGGRSTLGGMIADAGGVYPLAKMPMPAVWLCLLRPCSRRPERLMCGPSGTAETVRQPILP